MEEPGGLQSAGLQESNVTKPRPQPVVHLFCKKKLFFEPLLTPRLYDRVPARGCFLVVGEAGRGTCTELQVWLQAEPSHGSILGTAQTCKTGPWPLRCLEPGRLNSVGRERGGWE